MNFLARKYERKVTFRFRGWRCVRSVIEKSFPFYLFYTDPAEIIQTRYNDSEGHYEYYVHYEGHNRRLDEWVPRDRIMSSRFDMTDRTWKTGDRNSGTDLLADSSDRKITRNQKRRHDEINHIQKVLLCKREFYE